MENTILSDLQEQRVQLLGLIGRANDALADIDERIRLQGGSTEADFSGAVAKLRAKGVLPTKK